jgi:release factor glutamine methyltransferase
MAEQRLLDLVNSAASRLETIEIDACRINVERMICSILKCSRVDLYLDSERMVTSDIVEKLENLMSRRLAYEPLQYILGETEFYGLSIKCDSRALIPRPETEFVVSQAIERLEELDRLYILDLGCGTGCIGIALAMNLPQATVVATDISEDSISLARENVIMHNLQQRFKFLSGDIFEPVRNKGVLFDAVVCNPPYIREDDVPSLHRQITEYEPATALTSGPDGLDFVRRMLTEIDSVLVPGGYLIFEIGMGQSDEVRSLVDRTAHLELLDIALDYSEVERVVITRRMRSI